jgi:ADP-glucose pyrophosphorylase
MQLRHPYTGKPVKLYRIYALKTFETIAGTIVEGTVGGYIQNENNLPQEDTSWVSHSAKVFDEAILIDSVVNGDAKIFENAVIKETYVTDKARIYGNSKIIASEIYNNVDVYDHAIVQNSILKNSSEVAGQTRVIESELNDGCKVGGYAKVNKCKLKFAVQVTGNANLENCCYEGTFTVSDKRINETLAQYPDLKIESGNASGTGNELDAF